MSFKETFDLNNGMASWPSFDTKPSIEKPVTFTPPPNIDYQEASYAANANLRNALDKYAAKHTADLEAILIKPIVEPKVFEGDGKKSDYLVDDIMNDILTQCDNMKMKGITPYSVRMSPGALRGITEHLYKNRLDDVDIVAWFGGSRLLGLKVFVDPGMAGFLVEGEDK